MMIDMKKRQATAHLDGGCSLCTVHTQIQWMRDEQTADSLSRDRQHTISDKHRSKSRLAPTDTQ